MPIIQLEWAKIKARLAGLGMLYSFSDRQAALLMSLAEQLTWRKSFDLPGYDFSDWDDLQADVADLQRALMMSVSLADLLAKMDDIIAAVNAIETDPFGACCSGTLEYGNVPGGFTSTDPVPQAVIDAGYAVDVNDQAGYSDYKCMAAHLVVNNMANKLLQLPDIIGLGGGLLTLLVGLLATFSGLGTVVIIAGLVIDAAALITLADALFGVSAEHMEDLAAEVETNRAELVCAMTTADGISGVLVDLKAKIDELWPAADALILKNLNLGPVIQTTFSGYYGDVDAAAALAAQGFDPADYTCDCEVTGNVFGIYAELLTAYSPAGDGNISCGLRGANYQTTQLTSLAYTGTRLVFLGNQAAGTDQAISTAAGIAEIEATQEVDGMVPWADRGVDAKRMFALSMYKGNLGTYTGTFTIGNWMAYLSNDDGLTGTWAPVTVTAAELATGFTFANNILTFNGAIAFNNERVCYLTVDGDDPL